MLTLPLTPILCPPCLDQECQPVSPLHATVWLADLRLVVLTLTMQKPLVQQAMEHRILSSMERNLQLIAYLVVSLCQEVGSQ